jgi:flagellar motor protein MotB
MNRVQQGMRAPAAHSDDWLITYADMITLLLCFFVIFFVILSSRKNGQEEIFAAHAPTPTLHDTRPTQPQEALARATQSDPKISAFNKPENSETSLAEEAAARIGQPLHAGSFIATDATPPVAPIALSSRPTVGVDGNPSLAGIGGYSKPGYSTGAQPKGDRISMFEISSSAFFGSGSADLSESGKSILRDVAMELKSNQYEQYHIVVEGHTDDTPIATVRFSSNWELSTARAAAVVHFFLDQGLPAQKLHAAGYADTRPKVPNRDADGNAIPENQAQNRRVVIRLEKIEASD